MTFNTLATYMKFNAQAMCMIFNTQALYNACVSVVPHLLSVNLNCDSLLVCMRNLILLLRYAILYF